MMFVKEGSNTEVFGLEVNVYACDMEGVIADKNSFSHQGALGFEDGGMKGECSVFSDLSFHFDHEEKFGVVIEWEQSDIVGA